MTRPVRPTVCPVCGVRLTGYVSQIDAPTVYEPCGCLSDDARLVKTEVAHDAEVDALDSLGLTEAQRDRAKRIADRMAVEQKITYETAARQLAETIRTIGGFTADPPDGEGVG